MDDTTQGIIQTAIAAAIRHGLTVAAGSLVTLGWIQTGQTASFVEIMSGIAIGILGYLWSLWQKKGLVAMQEALHHIHNDPQTSPANKQVAATAITAAK
jgi:ABC-type nickel/cobalt efflux system permease component RcnA